MKCPSCNSTRFENGRCKRCRYINDKSALLEDFYKITDLNAYERTEKQD